MIIGYKTFAAAAASMMLAGGGVAQAQPGYGYGDLPPPPYAYAGGGGYERGGCGEDHLTLLGAHAGVTVLGVDLGASAHLGVPVDGACGGQAVAFQPRPYAPPPEAYAPPPCDQSCGGPGYGYAPPPPPPQPYAYGPPCGCAMPPRW